MKQTALVTGASEGIGRELAGHLARDGFNLVLVARQTEKLQDLASKLQNRYGAETFVYSMDLSDPSAAETLYEKVRGEGLVVDILVNNAGFGAHGALAEVDPEVTFGMLQLNVVTLTQLTRFFLKDMLAQGRGRILNVASTAAFQPGPFMATYYASKAYVLSFSEALAEELRGSGVTVTTLCPGPTRTGFQERAGVDNTWMEGNSMFVMDVEPVARIGYRGMMKGQAVVIPGIANKLMARLVRFVPRSLLVRLARRVQELR